MHPIGPALFPDILGTDLTFDLTEFENLLIKDVICDICFLKSKVKRN